MLLAYRDIFGGSHHVKAMLIFNVILIIQNRYQRAAYR